MIRLSGDSTPIFLATYRCAVTGNWGTVIGSAGGTETNLLLDPTVELSDPRVHTRVLGSSATNPPGHDACQDPFTVTVF